jgi:hypothetical protein
MNTFTITFKNALGELKTEEITFDFETVEGVAAWFEINLGLPVKSISKH